LIDSGLPNALSFSPFPPIPPSIRRSPQNPGPSHPFRLREADRVFIARPQGPVPPRTPHSFPPSVSRHQTPCQTAKKPRPPPLPPPPPLLFPGGHSSPPLGPCVVSHTAARASGRWVLRRERNGPRAPSQSAGSVCHKKNNINSNTITITLSPLFGTRLSLSESRSARLNIPEHALDMCCI